MAKTNSSSNYAPQTCEYKFTRKGRVHKVGDVIKGSAAYKYKWAKNRRDKARLESGRKILEDLPSDSIQKMAELHAIGLTFGKIAKKYGVSRYLVEKAVKNSNALQK
jgi:hypothetical protein